jgi:hypothetical protein
MFGTHQRLAAGQRILLLVLLAWALVMIVPGILGASANSFCCPICRLIWSCCSNDWIFSSAERSSCFDANTTAIKDRLQADLAMAF